MKHQISPNEMEISNLPDKEFKKKKNDYKDVHNTWEKKGGTQ